MKVSLIALAAVLLSSAALAQQEYVGRYDAFAGYSYFASPKLNLVERGVNGEFGINVTRWLALGADYSYFTGHSDIRAQDLTPAIQAQLAPLVPLLGPNPSVPFDSITYTFTAGPQINFRQLKWVTFFIRPAIGGLHEKATLKPNNPLLALVVQQIAPSGKKSDLQPFYGAGGGFDLNASRHFGLRVAVDVVHVKLFDGLLAEGRNSVRISVGPTLRFGRNVE
ncbi:MAG TPA: outer membrane beta-barrel protein [Candidatus Limnocylindrales bacterium]|nr:outer membrane beta-barrel protein [Candidatus Limnocylindrales bacterium]